MANHRICLRLQDWHFCWKFSPTCDKHLAENYKWVIFTAGSGVSCDQRAWDRELECQELYQTKTHKDLPENKIVYSVLTTVVELSEKSNAAVSCEDITWSFFNGRLQEKKKTMVAHKCWHLSPKTLLSLLVGSEAKCLILLAFTLQRTPHIIIIVHPQ